MSNEKELLEKLLSRMEWVAPSVISIPVDNLENEDLITWIPVNEICYITTDFTKADYNLMYVTESDHKFYSRKQLGEIEELLADNPRFMRTTKNLISNLSKIEKSKVSSARDLWFRGVKKPVLKAVSSSHLREFKKRFEVI